jgi:AmmeMemoRadiSam system protein A
MEKNLSDLERRYLLALARSSMTNAVMNLSEKHTDPAEVPARLAEIGASFVTLTIHDELRGCIGTLEAYQPLYKDVREHAIQAALEDYRFPPVTADELPKIKIEISRLTAPLPLVYSKPSELIELIRPNVDGVILKDGIRRATFLPQVWSQLPDPDEFFSHLCAKMGSTRNIWQLKILDVATYQVEEFCETEK